MATYDVPTAQSRLDEIAQRAALGEKITISTGSGNIVMIDEDDWDSLVDVVSAISKPQVLEAVRAALSAATEEA